VSPVGAALLVGALGLDQTAVAQLLLSQPLVGGLIIGSCSGDPAAGVLAGAFFQFLCLTDLPVGASVPTDTVLAGLIGVASFLALGRTPGWSDQAVLGLIGCAFVPLAVIARRLDLRVRRLNEVWPRAAASLLCAGRSRLAQAAAAGGVLLFFARGFVLALAVLGAVALWGGAGLERAAPAAPVFEIFARLVPLVGLAALIAQRRPRAWPAAVAAGLAAGVILSRSVL
jgi:mannose/fructose/N-acetylgalactosamine-specific phosphotransferase system component IIC